MRTPSQTAGPFFSIGLSRRPQNELPGGSVRLSGRVLDGEDRPVADAVVELWDPALGFARCATNAEGEFAFLLPPQARRLELMVFARGLLKHVVTRLYLPGEPAEDPTMVASEEGDGLRFDVHLQGEQETAFFEL
ncbi:MAG: protocatechuate 3,4-dioxygenase subunit alpha [Gaiellaceae bacterium]